MSQRAVPSSTTQPMLRDGDSKVERWTVLTEAAAELVALVVTLEVLSVALAVEVVTAAVLLEFDDAVTVTTFSVTVFVPLDPQPATINPKAATTANAPITLVTIESLYRHKPTGRFQT